MEVLLESINLKVKFTGSHNIVKESLSEVIAKLGFLCTTTPAGDRVSMQFALDESVAIRWKS